MQEILFDEVRGTQGDLGIITLNRPQVLNSLNHQMILSMHAQLEKWAEAKHIKAVLVQAANGRAFCAGGDLREMYHYFQTQSAALLQFFHDEYQLNRCIFHFPKPYIALLDGITMGGGAGISIHGSHRVATENLIFAMPETGIGFFPDVGGTYFLPRLSHRIGYYLGLTGAHIKADDSIAIGVATHKVSHNDLPQIITALANQVFSRDAKQTVTEIINQFQMPVEKSSLLTQQTLINHCFTARTMEAILQMLQQNNHEFAVQTLQLLAKKSPSSLKITLKALQSGSALNFDACMRQEFRLVSHFLQAHDFLEGVRALIIDKDQKPNWQPALLSQVSETIVDNYFLALEKELY